MFQKRCEAVAAAAPGKGRRRALAAVAALGLLAASGAASAAGLQVFDLRYPVAVNALRVGDSASQSVAPTATYAPGYGYLLNTYYLSAAAPEYFNYNIAYAPLTDAFASTRLWTGTLDPATGFTSNGRFLAESDRVGVAGGGGLKVEGSFLMDPSASYALIAGLLGPGDNPDGAYDLVWSVSAAARYPAPLAAQNPAAGIPETSTWLMMLLGFAGLGLAGFRRSRKIAPTA